MPRAKRGRTQEPFGTFLRRIAVRPDCLLDGNGVQRLLGAIERNGPESLTAEQRSSIVNGICSFDPSDIPDRASANALRAIIDYFELTGDWRPTVEIFLLKLERALPDLEPYSRSHGIDPGSVESSRVADRIRSISLPDDSPAPYLEDVYRELMTTEIGQLVDGPRDLGILARKLARVGHLLNGFGRYDESRKAFRRCSHVACNLLRIHAGQLTVTQKDSLAVISGAHGAIRIPVNAIPRNLRNRHGLNTV